MDWDQRPQEHARPIIDRLNKQINAGLADPKIVARLTDLGGTALVVSPNDLDKLVVDETEKWGKDSGGEHQAGVIGRPLRNILYFP
jgi:hypothetical protein